VVWFGFGGLKGWFGGCWLFGCLIGASGFGLVCSVGDDELNLIE
jgi:hypothetical protein